ncbi:cysteine dioxygenase family protein [Rhodococcus sp. X156]|uniref:cysteine dioxygenase n=1 Tax=Rhodococcus sp. X156 TaxID=2499145 RepID=UPI0013E2A61A|nr:cysteine dioxygenase family protein [Rhodococcus sp. X156]
MTTTLLSRPAAAAATETPTTLRLATLVRGIAAQPHRWRDQVRFSTRERCWSRLESPAGVDVWLLTWTRTQSTDLHSHGLASAALTVVQGTITEVRPDGRGGLHADRLGVGGLRTVTTGVIHDVRNERDEPAVSIHAYSPRLTEMTFYRLEDGLPVADRTVLTDEPEVDA